MKIDKDTYIHRPSVMFQPTTLQNKSYHDHLIVLILNQVYAHIDNKEERISVCMYDSNIITPKLLTGQ